MKSVCLILILFIFPGVTVQSHPAKPGAGNGSQVPPSGFPDAAALPEAFFHPRAGSFLIGFGAGGGLSFMTHSGIEGYPYGMAFESGVRPCLSTCFRIGYAPADRLVICWNSRANWFSPLIKDPYSGKSALLGGGAGLSASFFPAKESNRVYINVLFGYSNLGFGFKPDYNRLGTMISFGAGYLIMKHYGIELNIQTGSSEKWLSAGYLRNPVIMNLTINYLFSKN